MPKAVVSGFMHGQLLGTAGPGNLLLQPAGSIPSRDVINRIWADVVKVYPYQALQMEPSGKGGAFVGSSPEDVVVIQPPLIQVRALVDEDPKGMAGVGERVAYVFRTIAHHLGGPPPQNLGVKVVYLATAPGHDAPAFVRAELVKGDEDIRSLAGGLEASVSVKIMMHSPEVAYTLVIEPRLGDPTLLYLDLDAQFPGLIDIEKVDDRVHQADQFMTYQVKNFLGNRSKEWQ